MLKYWMHVILTSYRIQCIVTPFFSVIVQYLENKTNGAIPKTRVEGEWKKMSLSKEKAHTITSVSGRREYV